MRGRRLLPLATLLMAGAALAQPGGGRQQRGGMGVGGYADPSGVISAEMAKGRLSVEKGESVALAKTGAKDAILFVPDPVYAQRWLKERRGPQVSVRLHTRKIFMACDGRVAVSTGQWVQSDGQRGRYSTVWRRDPKAGFQWILSHDGPLDDMPATEAEDEIEARVAFCRKRERPRDGEGLKPDPNPAVQPDSRQPAPMSGEGASDDGSLRWRWAVATDKSRLFEAWIATDTGEAKVVTDRVPPPRP